MTRDVAQVVRTGAATLPPARSRPRKPAAVALLCALLVSSVLLPGCLSARRTPNFARIFAESRLLRGKRPLIIVPGILGTELVNRETGQVVWPSVFRSSVDGLGLPMSPDIANNRDNLIPRNVIAGVKLVPRLARLVPEVYVYRELLEALKTYGGYTEGDWNNPGPDGDHDTYYLFPYDWRRDNVETARLLIRKLDDLKLRLHNPQLRFNIVAHSMGGLVARYASRYGDADLPSDGSTPVPTWAGAASINKIIMLGTPNEGSAEAFSTLLEGFSVTSGLRPRIPLLNNLSRDQAITAPSLYQLLPHQRAARFLDENLKPMQLDIYDAATWREYGWTPIFNEEFRRRFTEGKLRRDGAASQPGTIADLDGFLKAVLDRARQFEAALDAPSPVPARVTLLAYGGDCEETLAAPVILRDPKRGRWVTLIAPREIRTANGRRISRRDVIQAMFAPGDGVVTRSSLLGEVPGDTGASPAGLTRLLIANAVFACDLHGDLQSNKTLEDNTLTALISDAIQ